MHRCVVRAGLVLAVAVTVLAPGGPPSSFAAAAGNDETIPVRLTAGGELTAAEDAEVRATLLDYLGALQRHDWKAASRHIDRESFFVGVEPMIASIAPDPAKRLEAMRMVFGVSTMDSLRALDTTRLFGSVMSYAMAADPASVVMMDKAKFALLGARHIKDRVVIAYQLTVPAESDSLQPYTQVTAEKLKRVGKEWKIVFQHDQ